MKIPSLPVILLGSLFSLSAQAAIVSMTTPDQSGVAITTILDTDTSELTYSFDFSPLPYDYENIGFSPSPLPAFDAIPLSAGAVVSPGLTEWNFHQILDPSGAVVDWSLEIQYMNNTPPPGENSILINYKTLFNEQLTGILIGQPGDDNFQVTYRQPLGGFPAGQEDNITFWAYVPEVKPIPVPPAFLLFFSGLLALAGIGKRALG
jgi:hypothetical protein